MENIHVLPVDDVFPHSEKGLECSCNPRLEQEDGGMLVIHNSFDGREKKEQNIKAN